MQLFIEAEPPTEPQAISQRMSELSVRMARSGYLLSKAKYEQELAMLKASRLKDLIPLAPSIQKKYFGRPVLRRTRSLTCSTGSTARVSIK